MGLAIGGVIANWCGVLIVYLNALNDYSYNMMLPFVIISALISTIGLIIAAAGSKKIGGILVIIGSILFIPLGLIGIFGGKKVMGADDAQTLEMRRNQLKQNNQHNLGE